MHGCSKLHRKRPDVGQKAISYMQILVKKRLTSPFYSDLAETWSQGQGQGFSWLKCNHGLIFSLSFSFSFSVIECDKPNQHFQSYSAIVASASIKWPHCRSNSLFFFHKKCVPMLWETLFNKEKQKKEKISSIFGKSWNANFWKSNGAHCTSDSLSFFIFFFS